MKLRKVQMGYCPCYQSIPEDSDLARRLRSDRRLAVVLNQFFPTGSYPLDIDEEGLEEFEEELDWILESEGEVFRSRADIEAALADLKLEIRRAEGSYPGLIGRTTLLNKSQHWIEPRLVRALESLGRGDASRIVQTMLFGEQNFAPGLDASLIPARVVSGAADLLRPIEPAALFAANDERYLREDYRGWRALFFEAAGRGEAILVY